MAEGNRISAQGMAAAGFLGFVLAWGVACFFRPAAQGILLVFLVLAAGPMIGLSVLNGCHQRETSGLIQHAAISINWPRCAIKLSGLLVTLLLLGLCYGIIPEYSKPQYRAVWEMVSKLILPTLLVCGFYFVWMDRRMQEPHDGYWNVGLLVVGRWRSVNWREVKNHATTWMVKGFFFPFMMAAAAGHLGMLVQRGVDFTTFATLYGTTFNLILSVDVTFGVVGYLLTCRALDSHIRSTNPMILGWVAALCCYPPFSTFLHSNYLEYGSTHGREAWQFWLFGQPVIYITWGFLILVLHGVYTWATCSFGLRFSNLTNRGIIREGPYRYLRHPAYVCKNLAWWMMFIPFLGHGSLQANLKASLFLFAVNFIYYLRAWTEEHHLKSDPEYVEYCRWMDEHGLWARFKKWLGLRLPRWSEHY
jgi:protein-S-isoprenylcysteine O-methyltransferase Ste14